MSVHGYALLVQPVEGRGIIFLLDVGIFLRTFNEKGL